MYIIIYPASCMPVHWRNMTIALTVYWSYQTVIEKGRLQRE